MCAAGGSTLFKIFQSCSSPLQPSVVWSADQHSAEPRSDVFAQMKEGLPEGCRLVMLGDVMKRGEAAPAAPMFIPNKGEDPLISLFYTSGSTGLPKGAMYTENVWKRYWSVHPIGRAHSWCICAPQQVPQIESVSCTYCVLSDNAVYANLCCLQVCNLCPDLLHRPDPTHACDSTGRQGVCCACRNRAKGGMGTLPLVASIMLGFLPLNHLMGRMGVLQCLSAGGTMTFVRLPPLCCDKCLLLCSLMRPLRGGCTCQQSMVWPVLTLVGPVILTCSCGAGAQERHVNVLRGPRRRPADADERHPAPGQHDV